MRIRIKKFKNTFILTSIILVVSIMSVIYFTLSNNFEQKEGNRLNVSLRNSAKEIDNFMLARVADFNVLSNNPLFSPRSSEITSQYLVRVVEQYPFYYNLFFVHSPRNSSYSHQTKNLLEYTFCSWNLVYQITFPNTLRPNSRCVTSDYT